MILTERSEVRIIAKNPGRPHPPPIRRMRGGGSSQGEQDGEIFYVSSIRGMVTGAPQQPLRPPLVPEAMRQLFALSGLSVSRHSGRGAVALYHRH